MNYTLSPLAERELAEAIDYYESRQLGLGERFPDEVHETIKRILYYPDGWTKLDSVFHRCLTKVFPFGIILLR